MYADRSFASRSYADATDAAAGRIPGSSIAPSVGPAQGGFAQAANGFRTFSDRSWAASGRAAGPLIPSAGQVGGFAQAAWAFRTWSDAAWAGSGNQGGGGLGNYGVTDGPGISTYIGEVHMKAHGVGTEGVQGIPNDAP